MIRCSELLEEYSDYRDDLLSADRVAPHLEKVASDLDELEASLRAGRVSSALALLGEIVKIYQGKA